MNGTHFDMSSVLGPSSLLPLHIHNPENKLVFFPQTLEINIEKITKMTSQVCDQVINARNDEWLGQCVSVPKKWRRSTSSNTSPNPVRCTRDWSEDVESPSVSLISSRRVWSPLASPSSSARNSPVSSLRQSEWLGGYRSTDFSASISSKRPQPIKINSSRSIRNNPFLKNDKLRLPFQ